MLSIALKQGFDFYKYSFGKAFKAFLPA